MAGSKRTGLGRGIGALIPTDGGEHRPVDVFFPTASRTAEAAAEALLAGPGARLANLSPAEIVPNAVQPRTNFDQAELDELVESIREVGVLQPIVVRPIEGAQGAGAKYELIMGERRLRACLQLGLESIPAIVKSAADDTMLRDALLENLHRANLNPLEEASAYQQLLSDFDITQDQLAERIGRSRPQISNTLRLLRLPISVQTKVAAGVLSAGHARAILSTGDLGAMEALAEKIVNEDLSVRAAETAAGRISVRPARAKPTAGRRQGQLDEIAVHLGDRLNTRVKISLGASRGRVVIDFATVGDLNRILGELGEPGFS
jgi:ParB family transcriptional regulator, chromosome partitioning protein